MRIRSFYVRGYRSLEDVELTNLGDANIFYGKNGAGKSNLLLALNLTVQGAAFLVGAHQFFGGRNDHGLEVYPVDFYQLGTSFIELRLEITGVGRPLFSVRDWGLDEVSLTIHIERDGEGPAFFRLAALSARQRDSVALDLLSTLRDPAAWPTALPAPYDAGAPVREELIVNLGQWFREVVGQRLFRLVPAQRTFPGPSRTTSPTSRSTASIQEHLDAGNLTAAMFSAATSKSAVTRRGFEQLRQLLAQAPLSRDRLDPVYDPVTNTYELQEVREVDGEPRGFPVSLLGLGVQNLYMILGTLLLGRTYAAGIEEPEAHLHAPSSGLHLRALLKSVVDQGFVQQLFITTHSNLFDLDPTGWWHVELVNGATRVTRRTDWSELHKLHLYEPGPARFALLDLMRFLPAETTVLRREDGSAVSAADMVTMLEQDAPEAVEFLRDVHFAAVRAVQLRAARPRT